MLLVNIVADIHCCCCCHNLRMKGSKIVKVMRKQVSRVYMIISTAPPHGQLKRLFHLRSPYINLTLSMSKIDTFISP